MDVESFRQWLDNDIQDIYLPEDVQMIHTDEREIEVSRRFGFAGSRGLSDAAYVGQYYTMFERAWAMTGYTDFLTYCSIQILTRLNFCWTELQKIRFAWQNVFVN